MESISSLERLNNTLKGIPVDRPPFTLQGEVVGYTDPFLSLFKHETGYSSPAEYFNFDIRGIFLNESKEQTDFSVYFEDINDDFQIDEWGVGIIPSSIPHLVQMIHPLRRIQTSIELSDYPFPEITLPYRFEGLKNRVQEFHNREIPVACFTGSIFEQAWYLRGFEAILMDFISNPELAHELLERITEILTDVSSKIAEMGTDIIILGDDIGGQNGLIISLLHYREFLKFRHKKVIQAVKSVNPEIQVLYHSDGNILDVIPDLIEIGIDILNPIQPECMDPAHVKSVYGEYLSFWGAISLQETMPFGTKDDIIQEIKIRNSTIGKGGRYVIAPAHVIGSDVPWANIVSFCEAVHDLNR